MSDHSRDGVDILAPAASGVRTPGRDPRERIHSSRFGTIVVLLVTAFVIAGGAWTVQSGTRQDVAAQTGGTTVVKLPGTSQLPPPEVGKPAQDFSITTTDGARVTLSELKGRVVWLTFSASWCTSCQAEAPDLQAAHEKYADRGLVLLNVSITESNATAKAYAERVGLTYRTGGDPDSLIADEYRVTSIPAHYFIDRDGIIRDIRQGGLAPAVIDSILGGMLAP